VSGAHLSSSIDASQRRSGRYQAWVVGLLSLNFGILFFDRNALNTSNSVKIPRHLTIPSFLSKLENKALSFNVSF
jgi:hypothetical protein